MLTVIKVQLPVTTNEKEPLMLVYNKDRSFFRQMPITSEIKEKMGCSYKKYFMARIRAKNGKMKLLKEVRPREW